MEMPVVKREPETSESSTSTFTAVMEDTIVKNAEETDDDEHDDTESYSDGDTEPETTCSIPSVSPVKKEVSNKEESNSITTTETEEAAVKAYINSAMAMVMPEIKRNEKSNSKPTAKTTAPIQMSEENNTKKTTHSRKAKEKHKAKKNGGKPLICEYCSKSFKRKDRLDVHLKLHTGDRPYICGVPNCFRSYTRLQHLQRHIERVHFADPASIDESKVECPDCHIMLANPECLKRHKIRFHTMPIDGSKLFECPEEGCNAAFIKKQQLVTHREKDHECSLFSATRTHVCPVEGCNKSFPFPTVLRRHMKIHQGYACKLCGDIFETYIQLRKHKAFDHGPELVCRQCNVHFKSRQTLVQHLKTHLFVKEVFGCTEEGCDRTFLYKKNLTQHIRAYHRGEKVFFKRKIPKEEREQKPPKAKTPRTASRKSSAQKLSGVDDSTKKSLESPLDLTVSGKEEPHASSSFGEDFLTSSPYMESSPEVLDFESVYPQTAKSVAEFLQTAKSVTE